MTDEKVFGLMFGMMAGALLGWLAPAIVSLTIITLVAVGYYLQVVLDARRRYAAYEGTAVAVMTRAW